MVIRSGSNPRVKATLKLKNSADRRRTGRFLIDGLLELQKALAAKMDVETVFYAGESSRSALHQLSLPPQVMWEVAPEILQKLSYGQRTDSLVAVAVTPELTVGGVTLTGHSLVLALDRTEKPGNLGACLRTAAACSVDAVVLVDPICEVFNPNTIRASRGAVFSVPLAICSRRELAAIGKDLRLRLLCSRVDGTLGLWSCDFRTGCIVVFGNESTGLDANWREFSDGDFTIPIKGDPDSLNLSISAAITLYEAVRQRSQPNI